MVQVRGLNCVDYPRGQVFRQADLEGRLHELWRVVVIVQHSTQHCGRTRQRPSAAVTSLD